MISHSFAVPVSRSLQVSFWLHNRRSRLLGGALWRACNLTSFSPCLTGPVDYPFASRHKGPGFKSPGGYLCETRIFLLVLSYFSTLVFFFKCISATYEDPPTPMQASQARWVGVRIQCYWAYYISMYIFRTREAGFEVVIVRCINNLGTGNLEWGGKRKGLRKGRSVYK